MCCCIIFLNDLGIETSESLRMPTKCKNEEKCMQKTIWISNQDIQLKLYKIEQKKAQMT